MTVGDMDREKVAGWLEGSRAKGEMRHDGPVLITRGEVHRLVEGLLGAAQETEVASERRRAAFAAGVEPGKARPEEVGLPDALVVARSHLDTVQIHHAGDLPTQVTFLAAAVRVLLEYLRKEDERRRLRLVEDAFKKAETDLFRQRDANLEAMVSTVRQAHVSGQVVEQGWCGVCQANRPVRWTGSGMHWWLACGPGADHLPSQFMPGMGPPKPHDPLVPDAGAVARADDGFRVIGLGPGRLQNALDVADVWLEDEYPSEFRRRAMDTIHALVAEVKRLRGWA